MTTFTGPRRPFSRPARSEAILELPWPKLSEALTARQNQTVMRLRMRFMSVVLAARAPQSSTLIPRQLRIARRPERAKMAPGCDRLARGLLALILGDYTSAIWRRPRVPGQS